MGRYPTSEEGLVALLAAHLPAPGRAEFPWGHPYQYRSPGTRGEYEIISTGKDGEPGGSGENDGISSQ